jgi:hypothetical protein
MNEMVERLAKALGKADIDNLTNEQIACAAIAAMREPTEWRIDSPEGKKIMALRKPAYIAACRQTNCAARGFDETNCGCCAYCADIADDIIETHSRAMIDAVLKED